MSFLTFDFNLWYLAYLAGVFILFFGFSWLLAVMRNKARTDLSRVLRIQGDIGKYFRLLDNPRLKLLFTRHQLDLLRLDGYVAKGDDPSISELINKLDKVKMNPYERLAYLETRLTFYTECDNHDEARKTLAAIEEMLANKTKPEAQAILEEAQTIVKVYIDKDINHIPQLMKKAESAANPVVKGIIYYRLAKLHYFANQPHEVNKYLDLASSLLEGTYYRDIISEARKNHQILQRK